MKMNLTWVLTTSIILPALATDLTHENIVCKAEKLRAQNRYICDSEGNVLCLPGWQEKEFYQDELFPCAQPICDNPECVNGVCSSPNKCSCEIGWDGIDCGTCIELPGCVHGNCTSSDGKEVPYTCNCHGPWKGALCNIPKCDQDCNGNGVCVRVAGEEHRCVCSPGWSGEQCETCDWIVGGGALCEEPRCINYDDGSPIECVNGECISGGKDSNGRLLPGVCHCELGWRGEKCDKCRLQPNCPNTRKKIGGWRQAPVEGCMEPNQCRCKRTRRNNELTHNRRHRYCTEWVD